MKYIPTVFLLTALFPIMFFAQTSTKKLGVSEEKISQMQAKTQTLKAGIYSLQKDVSKKSGKAKMPVASSDLFYLSHFVENTYRFHSFADPAVSDIFSTGDPPLHDATMDNNGNMWGVDWPFGLHKINLATKEVTNTSDIIAKTGIAFNPVDNLLYLTVWAGALSTDLYSIDPANNNRVFIGNYPFQLLGLACSKEGRLYSVDFTRPYKLRSFTPGEPATVLIGTIDQPAGFVVNNWLSLEIDPKTDKCYLVTEDGGISHNGDWVIMELDLQTAAPTYFYDFGPVDEVFGLAFGNFKITHPSSGEVLSANQTYPFRWIGGSAYNIKIELSTNGGQSWSVIESSYPSIDNTYSWNVPQINSSNCLVKLTNLTDPGNATTSKQFEIQAPFQFVTGNFGDNWPSGSEQTISWYQNIDFSPIAALNKSGAPQSTPPDYIYVEISYSLNGMEGPWVSAGVVPSYNGIVNSFTVPLPGVTTDRGLFRISNVESSPAKAAAKGSFYSFVIYSTHYFSLYQLPTNNGKLVITSPNGGESYNSGSYQTLQWRKKGIIIGSFLLEYTINNGLSWNKINTTPVSGSVSRYNWVVPNANSSKCFVRISNYITKELYDISDNSFTITPAATQSEAANFPNPFNPSTRIVFGLDKSSFTSLKVYNSIGQQVSELVNRQLEAGTHEFEFNATKLPSGVYYYNLTRDGKSEIHKMLLLK